MGPEGTGYGTIITGRCSSCGKPIGLAVADLGKKPPPAKCEACGGAEHILRGIFEGSRKGQGSEK